MYKNYTREELIHKMNKLEKENKILKKSLSDGDFFKILDAIPVPIFFKNIEGRYIFCNQAFADYDNIPREKIIGASTYDLFPFEQAKQYEKDDKELFVSKGSTTFPHSAIINGKNRHFLVYRSYIDKKNLEQDGVIGVIIDLTDKKSIESRLFESESRYKTLFENAQIGIYQTSVEGNILEANPAIIKMLEFDSFEDLQKRNLETEKVYVQSMRSKFKSLIEKDGFVKDLESIWKTKYNELIIVKETARAIYNTEGRITHYEGFVENITERKIAESKLKENEKFFRNISENMLEMISLADADGTFKYVSESHFKYLQYKPEDLIGKNIFELMHPDDLQRIQAVFKEMLDKKISGQDELRYKKADGSYLWIEVSGKFILNQDGEIESVVFVSRDIEERRKSRQNLKFLSNTALTFLGLTVEHDTFNFIGKQLHRHLPNCLVLVTQYYKESNQLELKNLFGFDSIIEKILKFIGKHPVGLKMSLDLKELDFYNGKLNKIEIKKFRNYIDKIPPLLFDQLVKLININDFYYIGLTIENTLYGNIGIIPLNNSVIEDFKTIETFVYQASITLYRQEIEKQLEEAKELAIKADKLKSEFLANMSHEIRTPMNGILGFAQLLSKKEYDDDYTKKYLNIIHNNSKLLLNLINDIIDISKIEAEQLIIKNTEVCIHDICNDIYTTFSSQLNNNTNKEVQLRFAENKECKKTVLTDKNRLHQILVNLIGNAVKFTHHGFIEFGYHIQKNKEFIEFYVKDTGIGISEEHQKIIFDRFKQADSTSTRKYGGTGLGLAISKQLTELMGGKIWLESEINKGSEFKFIIPYQPVKSKPIIEEAVLSTKELNTKTILIVEDDYTSFLFLETILNLQGAKVLHAHSASACFEILHLHPKIDLILMDIQLPKMNGYEATKLIRKEYKEIPIIAQTANAMEGDREKALEAGCNDYITKPINQMELIDKIQSLI